MENNNYTQMQKSSYNMGTSNHLEHNDNPDYWDILLGDLKDKNKWKNKKALDFACGKGRNVINMLSLCDWERVDCTSFDRINRYNRIDKFIHMNPDWGDKSNSYVGIPDQYSEITLKKDTRLH